MSVGNEETSNNSLIYILNREGHGREKTKEEWPYPFDQGHQGSKAGEAEVNKANALV